MRIALAGFNLESVTFLPKPTSLQEFETAAKRSTDLIASFEGTNTVPGGFIKVCKAAKVDILPLVYSEVGAAAAAADQAFDHFLNEIAIGILKAKQNIDGILLGLHGALVTETGRTDLDFLIGLRKIIGHELPIGVAFDLHGNLSPKLTRYLDVVSAYHESPHIDMGETGERVANFLLNKLTGATKPITVIHKVPITLPSIFTATKVAPLSTIMAEARRQERITPSLLDCSIVMGFAYADVAQVGISIVATSDGDIKSINKVVDHMSKLIWSMRDRLYPKDSVLTVDAGISRAMKVTKNSRKPAVILEHADRMNDSTYVLHKLLKEDNIKAAVPYLYDPESALLASKAGVNNIVSLVIGGKTSTKAGAPVSIEAKVLWAGKPEFAMGGIMGRGRPINLGNTAIVEVGGIIIWLISSNISAINLDPFEQFGFNHHEFDIVLLRSKTHFRAVWEREACEIIIVDTPDWGPALLDKLDYHRVRSGVFPISL
ncbi:MAG: microcystin degradation protein MlrC [Rhodospirillaceae bacterium]|nr:microcystin degradation protein MlrC [Rhodospirillaceae bacterium]|tara:strand:- start:319 stop:1782 length:1464 start_codon:yes stop_codon:yes gene_type:complete